MKSYLKSFTKKSLVLNIGVLSFIILFFYLSRPLIDYPNIFQDVSAWSVFYTVFGVLYAILAGFLIMDALSRFNDLKGLIEGEVNSLADISELIVRMNVSEEVKTNVLKGLIRYAEHVISVEWPEMVGAPQRLNSQPPKALQDLLDILKAIDTGSKKNELLFSILTDRLLLLGSKRTDRIALTRQKIPFTLSLLLDFMSWTIIAGFIMMKIYGFWVHLVMVATLVVGLRLLNTIIEDIDHPFEGAWVIKPFLFKEFIRSTKEMIGRVQGIEPTNTG